ncbi:MAG: NAD(+) synthase [Luteolibacter sp.]
MTPIHLTAVALNQTPLAWTTNAANIRAALAEARAAGSALVCLPELCITGYGCEDAFLGEATCLRAWDQLLSLLPDTSGMVVSIGLPLLHGHCVYNVAALVVDGALAGLVAKQNLAGDGIHYEPRWFKPWPVGVTDRFRCPVTGAEHPLGDLIFEVGGVAIGFEICEDAWVAGRPGTRLASRGIDVLLNPSASHFAFGKDAIRRGFVTEGSRAFCCAYVYANLLGNEAGRVIYDGQTLIAAGGTLLAEGSRFGFGDRKLLHATADLSLTRAGRSRSASYRPDLPLDDGSQVRIAFDWPDTLPTSAAIAPAPWEDGDKKAEEFTRAVTLGLFDYLRKSRARGYVVSLSGGADSSAVAALVRLMLDLATDELGHDVCAKRLGLDPADLTPAQLLLTAYQGTANSGAVTRNAAREVAAALGSAHHELEIEAIHAAYKELAAAALGRPLDWQHDDIPLQNIQARVRSPGIWMLANLRNGILLSTSNRSEAAVGYATMDGDTSGGLAPVSGIDKAWLRQWLCWLETTGPRIGDTHRSIPALAAINRQQPTAELRPPSEGQTDEDDLMPYPVLDFIERAAIRDKRPPKDILPLLLIRFPAYDRKQHIVWLKRFFRLWSRNQWKRERYAPGFHLDDENLDPKTWCRWPILNGGFEEELSELQ